MYDAPSCTYFTIASFRLPSLGKKMIPVGSGNLVFDN